MSLWVRFFRHNANAIKASTAMRKVLGRRFASFPDSRLRRQCIEIFPDLPRPRELLGGAAMIFHLIHVGDPGLLV
jgi:hypothetical protein